MRFKFKKILPLLIILLFAVSGYLGAYLSENSPDISNDENTEAAGQRLHRDRADPLLRDQVQGSLGPVIRAEAAVACTAGFRRGS